MFGPLVLKHQTVGTDEAPVRLPLQPERRRRLSVYDDRVNGQTQSPFFTKLPGELRNLIYEFAMRPRNPEAVMHVAHDYTLKPLKLVGTKHRCCHCTSTERDLVGFMHPCWADIGRPLWKDNLLALPLTCRMAYVESIDALYKYNTFDLRYTDLLSWLPTALPWIHASRLHSLNSLSLSAIMEFPIRPQAFTEVDTIWASWKGLSRTTYWTESCRALEGLKGLRDLRITIQFWHPSDDLPFAQMMPFPRVLPDDESLYWLLFPLQRVMLDVKVRRFVVALDMEVGSDVREMLGPVPFQIEQRERVELNGYRHRDREYPLWQY
ncbi:hypothetical protein SLS58_007779 [Diplodia intermedia]|uniref:DUF7730 domain-containing protein n=1 Tax=Diplodia intermedia TaxID=856260 RepID=A0ABR3TJ90_9PEZI